MHRVLCVFLPSWPIDRLRRNGLLPIVKDGAAPGSSDSASAEPVVPAPTRALRAPPSSVATGEGWGGGRHRPNEFTELPFATVVAANGRQLLAAVNPAAAEKGLAPGLPLADALSFLPGLAIRPAVPAEDEAALLRLAEWCGRYSPWTAPDGVDGVKIEVTGSAHLWGGEAQLAADLSRRLARQGISHRLAIADTLGAAWAVARCKTAAKAAAVAAEIVMSEKTREAIAPLPVAALRLDPALVQGLYRVGLRRVGEVMAMPRAALARRFGEEVTRRLDQALGDEPEPLSPLGEVPARRVRLSFAEPIADPADLARAIERLTEDLVARLAREGMGARRLDLGFHRVDGRVEHIRIGTARPSRDAAHLARLMTGRLDAVDPGLGIEDAILAAFAVDPLAPKQLGSPILLKANPRGSDLALLFDRLGARLGLDALARLEPCESHIPERASVAVPVADEFKEPPRPPMGGEGGVRAVTRDPHSPIADAPGTSLSRDAGEGLKKPPRPVRLFAPPEPIEAVVWVLPDDPPSRFAWRRRTHRVARSDGPERIAEEWWRPDGQLIGSEGVADAIRDYYRVEDETGRRFWLFRAGLPGDPPPRWFIHGLFA